jgi:hypothetical protein
MRSVPRWNGSASVVFPGEGPLAALAYFYGGGQHLATRTSCLLDLGEPTAALALAGRSLAAADPTFVRNVAFTRVFGARAHVRLGDLDAACAEVAAAAAVSRGNTSLRLSGAITAVRRDIAARAAPVPPPASTGSCEPGGSPREPSAPGTRTRLRIRPIAASVHFPRFCV